MILRYARWVGYPARVFFAFIVSAVVINVFSNLLLGEVASPIVMLGKGVAMYALTLLLLAGIEWAVERRRLTKQILGVQSLPTWAEIGYGLGGLVLYLLGSMILIMVVKQLVPGFDANQAQDIGFRAVYGIDRLLAFGLLVVVAPIVEEMIFRGYLYAKLRDAKMPLWLVVIVVSGCFALAHGQWNVGVDVFALSVVACILRYITGTIWPGVLLHMLKNLIAFYILFVAVQGVGG